MKLKYLSILAISTSLFFSACSNPSTPNEDLKEMIENPASAETPNKTADLAEMTFDKTEHNFGDMVENQVVETIYKFTNTSKNPLLINDVTAPCGCTVPSYPKEPIKAGGTGEIKVVFNSAGKGGINNREVTVLANIKEGSMPLKFKANVREIANTNPNTNQ